MRIWIIGSCCGVLVGVPWLALAIGQFESDYWFKVQTWLTVAVLFVPMIVNALLAVFLHMKRLASTWLMLLPTLFLIPSFDTHPKAITAALPAGLIWLAGCFSMFVVERCKPTTNPSSTSLKTESELS